MLIGEKDSGFFLFGAGWCRLPAFLQAGGDILKTVLFLFADEFCKVDWCF